MPDDASNFGVSCSTGAAKAPETITVKSCADAIVAERLAATSNIGKRVLRNDPTITFSLCIDLVFIDPVGSCPWFPERAMRKPSLSNKNKWRTFPSPYPRESSPRERQPTPARVSPGHGQH